MDVQDTSGSATTFFQPLSAPKIEHLPGAVQSYLCTYLSLDEFKAHFESAGISSPRLAALPLDPRLKPPLNSVLWGAARGAQDRLAFGLEALMKIPEALAAGDESSLLADTRFVFSLFEFTVEVFFSPSSAAKPGPGLCRRFMGVPL